MAKEPVKRKLTDFPEYCAAQGLLDKAYKEINLCEKNIARVSGILNAVSRGAAPLPSATLAKALRYLGVGNEAGAVNESALRDELQSLYQERNMLSAAVDIQRQSVDKIREAVSKKICEAVANEHREIVRQQAAAFKQLIETNEREIQFRDSLEADGVSYLNTIRPMPVNSIGRPNDVSSFIHFYFHELVENNFLNPNEVPPAIRVLWN